jgi:hypothetical protein
MQSLNFPKYIFRLKTENNREQIFDTVRKKWVALTPEEWVRQHLVQYLVHEKKYPISLIAVEAKINLNKRTRRCDVILFNQLGNPVLIAECKAPEIKINQKTFDQIAAYNMKLNVDYLLVSNGMTHYCCRINDTKNNYEFLENIPDFREING